MRKNFLRAILALVLVVVSIMALVPASNVEAAPPPSYDSNGRRVAPPPFVLTEAKLPASTSYDVRLNRESAALRKSLKASGWIMHEVKRKGNTRVYTYEKIVGNYLTKSFQIRQYSIRGMSFFAIDGRTYSQLTAIKYVRSGRLKTVYLIY